MTDAALEPIQPRDLLHSRLVCDKGDGRSSNQLASDLSGWLDKATVIAAIETLREEALLEASEPIRLTASGRQTGKEAFGPADKARKRWGTQVLPALALGLDPTSPAAKRLARGEILRAVLLVRIYALPLDVASVTLAQAVSALVIRGLSGTNQARPLRGLDESLRSLGTLSDVDKLRHALPRLACALAQVAVVPGDGMGVGESEDLEDFAARVRSIVAETSTPPFSTRAAIAQVYDAYGLKFADAGSLKDFKRRLLIAMRVEQLSLSRLDDPRALDKSLARRSEIETRSGGLHFVDREG